MRINVETNATITPQVGDMIFVNGGEPRCYMLAFVGKERFAFVNLEEYYTLSGDHETMELAVNSARSYLRQLDTASYYYPRENVEINLKGGVNFD